MTFAIECDKVAADLRNAGRGAQARASVVVRKVAADMTRAAQQAAPVDTGNLRSSIGYAVHTQGGVVEAVVSATAAYAEYVEYGTSRMRPQPFMRPAFDRVSPTFEAAIEQLGGDVL